MSAPQPTRAELMERIRASSKDAVVLAEMQRLGFWPKGEGQPDVAAELIEREAALRQQLAALRQEAARYADPEKALRDMRRERMAAAREQREATRRQRNQARHERALDWHARRDARITWLGEGVSFALNSADSENKPEPVSPENKRYPSSRATPNDDRLARHGLPMLASPTALATAMGIPVRELRFLATHREVSRSTHYQRFTVPKKTGGERLISAPMPRLKRAQYWVLDNILAKVPVHEAAHGFLPGHSIVGNARPHTGQDVVVNLDLQDFFPSVTYPRIKGVFRQLGYGEGVATVLALLCSEARADALVIDGERVHIAGPAKARVLPQGAPTSPQLTNVLCRTLDRRLAALAGKLGFAYTRYADDLSFSASGDAAERVGELLRRVRWIVQDEGFTPHPTKQAVMRRGRRQTVTGLVVNDAAPSVSRTQRRRLRAALHRAQAQGLAQATNPMQSGQQPVTRAQLIGWAQFVHQVRPAQGQPLLAQAMALLPPVGEVGARGVNALAQAASGAFRQAAAQGRAPLLQTGTPWWEIAPRPEPVCVLTDQERREQRQARRPARPQAAAPATRQAAAAPGAVVGEPVVHPVDEPADGKPAPRRLTVYLLQLAAAWAIGNGVLHDRRFTIAATLMLAFLYIVRKQSWWLWGCAMVLSALVAWSLRFLG